MKRMSLLFKLLFEVQLLKSLNCYLNSASSTESFFFDASFSFFLAFACSFFSRFASYLAQCLFVVCWFSFFFSCFLFTPSKHRPKKPNEWRRKSPQKEKRKNHQKRRRRNPSTGRRLIRRLRRYTHTHTSSKTTKQTTNNQIGCKTTEEGTSEG